MTEVHFMKNTSYSPASSSPFRKNVYTNETIQKKAPYVPPYKNGKKNSAFISPSFLSGDCFYPQYSQTPNKSANYIKQQTDERSSLTPKSITPRNIPQLIKTPSKQSKQSENRSVSSKSVNENNLVKPEQSDASSSKISELVCPDCYNKEVATAKKKQCQIQKYQDLNYIQNISQIDQSNLQKEREREQQIKNFEKDLKKEQYEQFRKTQELKNLSKIKEQQELRQKEQEELFKQREEQRFILQQEKIKREQFLDGIKQQIQERDEKKKKLLQAIENQNKIYIFGEEHEKMHIRQQQKEQEKQMLKEQMEQQRKQKEMEKHQIELQQKEMQKQQATEFEKYEQQKKMEERMKKENQQKELSSYLEKAINENNFHKQKEKEEAKMMREHIQKLDIIEQEKQKQQSQKEIQKRLQFLQGLDEQIKDKVNRQQQKESQREDKGLSFAELNKSPDFRLKQNELFAECDECNKGVLKDYLTKIRKSKN